MKSVTVEDDQEYKEDKRQRKGFKTSLSEKIAYGMGDVACNVVYALTSGLLVYFYTNVIGVPAGVVGTILLVSRIFDGISDLAIAQLMDKINSKHGKARAWILWMSVPYALTAVALFVVPANATLTVQTIYIFISYNLCTTIVYTGLNLPYSAMAPLMTNDDDDLAKLNLFRMSMSPISNMIVTALTLPFINRLGGDQKAWITVTAVYGVVAFGMLIWTFLGTKERFHTTAAAEAEALPFTQRLKAAGQNKYFIIMFMTVICLSIYQNVNGTVSTYYAQYILGNAELMGLMQTFEKIPWILGIMFMAPLIKRFGKRNLVLWGAILCVAAQVLIIFSPKNLNLILFSAVLRGLGEAPINGLTFTMIADVINYGHWKTGIRVHALIFSTFTVGQKFGGGITGWAIGQLLEVSGFTGSVREVPSAISMVQNLYIYGTIIAWVAVAICMLKYNLDKEYDKVMLDLEKRESEKLSV
ncbi:MFS transporter [Enterococcus sp. AZ072]|uniref:MFS transporter n=1 Tax=unclassified Enterococcus TaxID=2608891 RepID=UPI003D28EDD0